LGDDGGADRPRYTKDGGRADGTQSLQTAVEPMTLGHMRRNGVHSLLIACQKCRHEVVMTANLWGDDVPVPAIGPRMICSKCGNIGADSRPNWQDRRTD
jgi:hypothetical protein